ncbi:MAG: peptidylprolyl isomerase [Planctomycetota bacterium]|jgi:parvulin-like peptidyl-prolyl isomerase
MALIIEGERIEDSLIQQEVERLRPHYEQVFADKDPDQRDAQLLEWSRENVIERVLLKQHASQNAEPIPSDQINAAFEQLTEQAGGLEQLKKQFSVNSEEQIKEQLELDMKIERMISQLCDDIDKPSKDAITGFYEQNKEQLTKPEEIRVAHIVKHIDGRVDDATAYDAIKKAHEELSAGGLFEAVALKYSDCPDNGGDLGYITRGRMVEEFEDVVFNLGQNQVSDIFQTRFGYHIAKVYDRKPQAIPQLKEVEEQIVNELKRQMADEAIDRFVDDLKSTAKIEDA